ncbi:MAG: GTP-binding protein [Burkholderiales bacterium]
MTILTEFFGSGKTTLLNRIPKEDHGKRMAVIVAQLDLDWSGAIDRAADDLARLA